MEVDSEITRMEVDLEVIIRIINSVVLHVLVHLIFVLASAPSVRTMALEIIKCSIVTHVIVIFLNNVPNNVPNVQTMEEDLEITKSSTATHAIVVLIHVPNNVPSVAMDLVAADSIMVDLALD